MKKLIGIISLKKKGQNNFYRLKVYEKECGSISYALISYTNARRSIHDLECNNELPIDVYEHEDIITLFLSINNSLMGGSFENRGTRIFVDDYIFKNNGG